MPNLKLARLPDRVPVKLTLTVQPDLHRALCDYVVMYAEVYGEQARVEDLVPAMLASFLESDRAFSAARAERARAARSR
jgi:hypothetical protein